jgi:hypothetical protein
MKEKLELNILKGFKSIEDNRATELRARELLQELNTILEGVDLMIADEGGMIKHFPLKNSGYWVRLVCRARTESDQASKVRREVFHFIEN